MSEEDAWKVRPGGGGGAAGAGTALGRWQPGCGWTQTGLSSDVAHGPCDLDASEAKLSEFGWIPRLSS